MGKRHIMDNRSRLRMKIYAGLVNRKAGISFRYHKLHDGSTGMLKGLSLLYLLWLNFAYYVLFMRFLGEIPKVSYYEEKKLNTTGSESESWKQKHPELRVKNYVNELKDFDVISFDLFDTLIFRPFDKPTDLFLLVGEKLDLPDYKNIRIKAEEQARQRRFQAV